MFPYKTKIFIDRKEKQPVYLQIANQLIELIKTKVLPADIKLPSSRVFAELLGVHRKTIVASFDELILQGWIVTVPKKGTFVNAEIPILSQQTLAAFGQSDRKIQAGFSFDSNEVLDVFYPKRESDKVYIDDGVSDARLTPTKEIAMIYRSLAKKANIHKYMTYGTTYGSTELREVLVNYLNETRGLNISIDNVLITRGSQMGIFLTANLLRDQSGVVLTGETNYLSSDVTFLYNKSKLVRVPVDENGLDTAVIEKICKKQKVKAIYVTSHHHHPTTVTMSAERRIHLLNLSSKYKFAILEDDYDYDFHYNHAPILPLASHDTNGNVIYVGSVCKTVAPVYRVGYLIASKDFVDECAKLRRFVDRQGDYLLEWTFARFIKSGDLDRHIKKVIKIYKNRRDLFCNLMSSKLGEYFSFEIPMGGMAVWVKLNTKYQWNMVQEMALKHNLVIGYWQRYDPQNTGHNAIRMGFAANNEEEIIVLIDKLHSTLKDVEMKFSLTNK